MAAETEERGSPTCPGRGLPHASAARYFPWRTVKDERYENNISSPAHRPWRGGVRAKGSVEKEAGKGSSFREEWLQAKVYLYSSEVCENETWQTGEPVFDKSHMIYNNRPAGKFQKSPVNQPASQAPAAESISRLDTDGSEQPEKQSPTITRGQLLCVCNYGHMF